VQLIYKDESGDVSFADSSRKRYFILACLSLEEVKRHELKNTNKSKKKKIYGLGWPKEEEIKASSLHRVDINRKHREEMKVSINGYDYIREMMGYRGYIEIARGIRPFNLAPHI